MNICIYISMHTHTHVCMSMYIWLHTYFAGVFSGLKEVVQRESFLALYKGNLVQMIRAVPYAAIQFTAFEQYKKVMKRFNITQITQIQCVVK